MTEGYDPRFDNIVTELLADAPHVRYLADEILSGELNISNGANLIPDELDYRETCEEIRDEYGVSQAQVEQAIKLATEKIGEQSDA